MNQRVRLAIALTLLAIQLLADWSRQDRKFVNAALVRYINSIASDRNFNTLEPVIAAWSSTTMSWYEHHAVQHNICEYPLKALSERKKSQNSITWQLWLPYTQERWDSKKALIVILSQDYSLFIVRTALCCEWSMHNSLSMVSLWKELGCMNESALVPTILNFLESLCWKIINVCNFHSIKVHMEKHGLRSTLHRCLSPPTHHSF